jgi:hypothetical protein
VQWGLARASGSCSWLRRLPLLLGGCVGVWACDGRSTPVADGGGAWVGRAGTGPERAAGQHDGQWGSRGGACTRGL